MLVSTHVFAATVVNAVDDRHGRWRGVTVIPDAGGHMAGCFRRGSL
ncbi:hypothetical protein Q2406_13135 [Klebsiella pneumoniae]|nr:hypothetical protein [Klebsiella pneumoniae]